MILIKDNSSRKFRQLMNIIHLLAQSKDSKYCYLILIIQFKHAVKEFQVLLFNINYTIQHYLTLIILFNIAH